MADGVYVLVFGRLLGLFSVAPIWGQETVPASLKGLLMLAITTAITPLVAPAVITIPQQMAGWVTAMFFEVGIGFFMGMVGRLILIVLDVVGEIMSFQMGLSFSTTVNPVLQSQTTVPAHLLTHCGVILMLALNMHHLFLKALVDSYHVAFSFADGAQHMVHTVALLFSSAMRLSAPFVVLHAFLQVTNGLMNRFVPTFSFFNVSIPINLLAGLLVLLATITIMCQEFASIIQAMWLT